MKLVFEPFTPSEVAEITGVSASNQRNLRRAGYLAQTEGHARFDLQEIARLLVIGVMSDRGIGPKVSTAFADTAARGIFLKALWNLEIYSAGAIKLAKKSTEADLADACSKLRGRTDLAIDEGTAERLLHASLTQEYLAESAEASAGAQGEKAPEYFFYWANGYPEFFYGEEHPFEDHSYGLAAWQGPVVMLSMGALAAMVAERLPRPAIQLSNSEEES